MDTALPRKRTSAPRCRPSWVTVGGMSSRRSLSRSRSSTQARDGLSGLVSVSEKVKELRINYERKCAEDQSAVHPTLRRRLINCSDAGQLMDTLNFQPTTETRSSSRYLLSSFLSAARSTHYIYLRRLSLCGFMLSSYDLSTLGTFIACVHYPVTELDMVGCGLTPMTVNYVARGLAPNCSKIESINLSHNPIGDEGLEQVVNSIRGKEPLRSLTINYCGLSPASGSVLGRLLSNSNIWHLSLEGNDLRSEGMYQLLLDVAEKAVAESEFRSSIQIPDGGNGSDSAGINPRGSINEPKTPSRTELMRRMASRRAKLVPGLVLQTLCFVNCGIDGCQSDSDPYFSAFLEALCNIISSSCQLKDLDIDHNILYGEGTLRILSALQTRKKEGLSPLKMELSNRCDTDVFRNVLVMANGPILHRRKAAKKSANGEPTAPRRA